MVNLIWTGFLLLLLLSGCGWDGTPTRHNDFVPLTSIEISAVSPTIAKLTSTKISVKGNYSGLFTRDITDQAVWTSDPPTVAGFVTSVIPNRVSGLAPGTAILTATVGGISATYALMVSNATVASLVITPADPSLSKGLSKQFSVIGTFSDATTQDLTFDAAWTSSAPAVASVSNAAASKGFAQALAVGNSTISATFGGASDSTLLTVTEPILQSIAVSPSNPSILSLSTGSFKATGHYSDGTTPDITGLVVWSSSQSGIASITTGGTVTTLAQGTTMIRATLGDVGGTTNLKVTGGNLSEITLSKDSIILAPNGTTTLAKDTVGLLTAKGTFSNGAIRDITGAVAWTVANPALATISTPGGNIALLNALAATPATAVTAKYGSVTATTNLSVTTPALIASGLTISPVNQALAVKTSGRFTVTAAFNDGTTQNVNLKTTWTSSNPAIAAVGDSGSDKGRVSGIAAGIANISAEYGGQTITAPVTVTARTLNSLTIPAGTAVTSGNQVSFTSTAIYSDGTSQDVTEDTVWTIDNPYVAILADDVNQPGQVVAVDTGLATLTASFGGKTQTLTVTVP